MTASCNVCGKDIKCKIHHQPSFTLAWKENYFLKAVKVKPAVWRFVDKFRTFGLQIRFRYSFFALICFFTNSLWELHNSHYKTVLVPLVHYYMIHCLTSMFLVHLEKFFEGARDEFIIPPIPTTTPFQQNFNLESGLIWEVVWLWYGAQKEKGNWNIWTTSNAFFIFSFFTLQQ